VSLRAISKDALTQYEKNYVTGLLGETEMRRLLESARVYREVLKILFGYFKHEPLRTISVADPVPNSELMYLKELVCMETE